ncbi:MAG: DUF2256 domain-containing protein [Gammaproteobacteria bacterium]|nr:DUF2256 domain-containing protein [Gammaproteobacteria bacterium]
MTKKQHLPTKDCAFCQRPFSWRKKWSRCWHEVRYCSKRCRSGARATLRKNRLP